VTEEIELLAVISSATRLPVNSSKKIIKNGNCLLFMIASLILEEMIVFLFFL
jgi:hypothetical protein